MYRPLLISGLVLVLASCSSSGNDPATGGSGNPVGMSGAHPPGSPPAANQQSAIPKGAQYTLFCMAIQGPLHVEQANQLRKDLISSTGMRDWYVVHQPERSAIYYGYYSAISGTANSREAARAQADRQRIVSLPDRSGRAPFVRALFVELAAPDPVALPQWNLLNAKGAYTLQIGVYKGSPDRKDAAVNAVREARAQGVEAFYLHGQTSSMVCVGAWPKEAIRGVDPADATARSDPSKPLMIVPETGDEALDRDVATAARKNDLQLVRSTVQVVDPTLAEAMTKFPYTSVNGSYIMHQSPDGKQAYDPSWVIPIPKSNDPNLDKSEQMAAPAQQPGGFDPNYRPAIPRQTDPTPAPQQPQQPTNIGRLRSITGG